MFDRLAIKGRLYFGFGVSVLLGLSLAIFASWQLSTTQAEMAEMATVADNSTRIREISGGIHAIRQAVLRYEFDADEASFKESADREAKTLGLLQDAAKTAISAEQKKTYEDVEGILRQMVALRETLGEAVRNMQGGRETLSIVGDELEGGVARFLEASRMGGGDQSLIQAALDLETDVLLVRVANWRFLATREPKGLATLKNNLSKAQHRVEALEQLDLAQTMRPLLASVKTALTGYAAAFETTSSNLLTSDELYRNGFRKLTISALDQIAAEQRSLQQTFAENKAQSGASISSTLTLQESVGGAVLIVGGLLAFLMARGISNPLTRMCAAMKALCAGNFEVVLPGLGRRDEIGDIAAAVEEFKLKAKERAQLEAEETMRRQEGNMRRQQAEAEAQTKTAQEQTHVVETLAKGLRSLSEGDLRFRLNDEFPSVYRPIKDDFNSAISTLEQAIQADSGNMQRMHSGTQELSSASESLSHRTEQQAASLEETSAALEQIMAIVSKTASGATHARQVVSTAKADAEKGGEVVRQAVEAMATIEASSKQIARIIGVIDEIAFQTNLLALNAGVEAARAGEAGRGFAVVASEVRALAQRSAEAAKEINGLISASTAQVDQGVRLVRDTGLALERIVSQVAEINIGVTEIAVSTQEQSTGLAEVNSAVSQLDQVTQQNAAMAEEATAATYWLTHEADQLAQLVGKFQLNDAGSDAIRNQLRKVAPHAFATAKAPPEKPAAVKQAIASRRPERSRLKAVANLPAKTSVAADNCEEF